ncbi:MAG: MBL fold metallo-hydrolase [Deltaproteobacteria bacterium]|nr:MBL fold metallo-hydrolase [Deltaproteobacteria bacterium]
MLEVAQIATKKFTLLSYIIQEPKSKETIIIDPPANIQKMHDINNTNIKAVINTHTHPDHILGNGYFKKKVPIMAHADEGRLFLNIFKSVVILLSTGRLPVKTDIFLSDGQMIPLGDTKIRVIHTPGHSPGSICLYWPGNLITGDTIFACGIGRTDIPGGNSYAIKKSIEKILELPDETFVWPGHYYDNRYSTTLGEIKSFLTGVLNI